MATDPVTVPRPRKVPESLRKTTVREWGWGRVGGGAGVMLPPAGASWKRPHLTARVEMTSDPQGAVSMGRKLRPSHLVR